MKAIHVMILTSLLSFASMPIFANAVEPVINYDVHVVKNATPDQCPASWKGDAGVDQETDYSGSGQDTTITSPGILSCSDCSIDKASGDCVCKTCYSDFDS